MYKAIPKISVIIPLYNHEKYIEETINSVLTQSFDNFELIIINDGSSDNSGDIAKKFNDKRIIYFDQENHGAPYTINRGINTAAGEYISILNSDDSYDAKRLEECIRVCEQDDSISAVFSHIEQVNEDGNHIGFVRGPEYVWTNHDPKTSFKGEDDILLSLLAGNFLITTSNLFCRKSVFNKAGRFSNLKYAHDYDFFLRLCYFYKAHIIEAPLLRYRIHETNTLKRNDAEVGFEVGLALSNFFLHHDLRKKMDWSLDTVLKYYNSINTWEADRLIMILFLYAIFLKDQTDQLFEILTADTQHPLRKASIQRIQTSMDLWHQFHEACTKSADKDRQILKMDFEIGELKQEIDGLKQKIVGLLGSRSYRLGKALTSPYRWLFNRR